MKLAVGLFKKGYDIELQYKTFCAGSRIKNIWWVWSVKGHTVSLKWSTVSKTRPNDTNIPS